MLGPGPHMSVQDILVRTIKLLGSIGLRVFENVFPAALKEAPYQPIIKLGPPHAPQHGEGVGRVVSHHMDHRPVLQPLSDSCLLPQAVATVQVPADKEVHLGVQSGEEPPVHGKDAAHINYRSAR